MMVRDRYLDRAALWLMPGANPAPAGLGRPVHMCLMEACAYVAGEPWTDRPRCVAPLLVGYGNMINDVLMPVERQRLKDFIPWLVSTGTDPVVSAMGDRRRAWVCARYVLRRWVPEYLESRGLEVLALTVREMAEVVDDHTAALARDVLRGLRVDAYAAGHDSGLVIEYAFRVAAELVMEGINGALGYRKIGEATAEAFMATHMGGNGDDSIVLFEELLQLKSSED